MAQIRTLSPKFSKMYSIMKRFTAFVLLLIGLASCGGNNETVTDNKSKATDFDSILDSYWEERMQLFPFEATANGDNRYNDKFTITIAESFRDSLGRFYQKYIDQLATEQQVSYGLLKYEMQNGIEGLKFPTHHMPINQFWAFTLELPQLGSGTGNQPFKTVKDYDDFLARLSVFPAWTDTAISNMRKGMNTGWVLPRALVVKMLPQLKAMIVKDRTQSTFYGPVKMMGDSFGDNKQRLTLAYSNAIDSIIIPSYSKLYEFFEKEYLPKARETDGISSVPNGAEYYAYCAKTWTTTSLSPDSIYK
jgi:uncharacterized protein (DUF885 family)